MANFNFDCGKFKRSFFNITLKNGKRLQVKMPFKGTFDKMQLLQNIDTENQDEATIGEEMEGLAEVIAEGLSNNLNKYRVNKKEILENYDLEEMSAIIDTYFEFIASIKQSKN